MKNYQEVSLFVVAACVLSACGSMSDGGSRAYFYKAGASSEQYVSDVESCGAPVNGRPDTRVLFERDGALRPIRNCMTDLGYRVSYIDAAEAEVLQSYTVGEQKDLLAGSYLQ